MHSGIRHPESVMKNIIPIVMAGGMCYSAKVQITKSYKISIIVKMNQISSNWNIW